LFDLPSPLASGGSPLALVGIAMPARKTPPASTTKPTATNSHRQRKARAAAKADANRAAEAAKVAVLPITNRHACGIDIGSRTHWVCVGFTADAKSPLVREFPAHTDGLRDIVAYLREHGVTTVAMESTGIYWVPLYEMLDQEGFEVMLVDPSYTKQVRGRPKTDKHDAQWIYRLHSVGLLAAAFRPDEKTAVLRNYLRQRSNLVRYAGQHIQHMQKALEQMNLKLTMAVSDITGVTGQKIIRAILKGTRDPMKLAALRDRRCKASEAQIAQALTGSYRDEHLFALRQAYEAWQFTQKQIDKLDMQIEEQLKRMKQDRALPALTAKARRTGRKPNDPRFDVRTALYYVVGIDLTELEGLDETSALVLISEIGTDMSKFATVKRFCSWLGLCPLFRKTGGKVKSSRTRPGTNRAATMLRLAASSLHNSKGALGAFLRRMKGRLGAPQAVTATAHKLARIVYYALKHGIQYVRKSQEEYEKQMHDKQLANLKRRARQLGLEVVEKPEAKALGAEPTTTTPTSEQTPPATKGRTTKAPAAKARATKT
jgi:transposase